MPGENLQIGFFGRIEFFVLRREYSKISDGKTTYVTLKRKLIFEDMTVADADQSRVWLEGIDQDAPETFNVKRSDIVNYEPMNKPK